MRENGISFVRKEHRAPIAMLEGSERKFRTLRSEGVIDVY